MGNVVFNDYILNTGAVTGKFVRLTNNVGGATFVSTAATDSNGMFQAAAPAGTYTVATGPSASGPWTNTGDGHYVISDPLVVSNSGIPVFNVKDPAYGAAGDGTTDDTTAINSAVTALNAAGGGILYFPQGTFRITSTLTILNINNIDVRGAGWGTSQIKVDVNGTNINGIVVQGGNNVGMHDLSLFHTNYITNTGTIAGITFKSCTRFDIARVEAYNIPRNFAIVVATSTDGQVHDCIVHDTRGAGIWCDNGALRVRVYGNSVFSTGDDALGCGNDTGAICQDIAIYGNTVRDAGANGVDIFGGRNVVVANNVIDGCVVAGIRGIFSSPGSPADVLDGILITGNFLKNCGNALNNPNGFTEAPAGIKINPSGGGPAGGTADNIVIVGNVIEGGTINNFVWIERSNNTGVTILKVDVLNNTFIGPLTIPTAPRDSGAHAGIRITSGTSVRCNGNRVFQSNDHGISLGNGGQQISGLVQCCDNSVDDCNQNNAASQNGIEILSGSTFIATGNSINDPNSHLAASISLAGTAKNTAWLWNNQLGGRSVAAYTNGPQISLGDTTVFTSAAAGTNGAVPAQVVGYFAMNVNGTTVRVPYFQG